MAEGTAPLRASRGPFVGGYTSAVPPFMAGAEQLVGNQDGSDTNSSRDCVIDPVSGSVSKRGGCAIVGDTVNANNIEQTGLLNKNWGARARKGFALDSPSMTDNYPVPAILFSEDTNTGFPTADSGFPGTLYVLSSNSGSTAVKNYSLLEEFSSTHYGTGVAGTTTDVDIKMVPICVDSGDGVYNRGALTGVGSTDLFMQQFLTSGSRSCLQTQSWLYFPNLRATPWRWNKRLNENTASGTEVLRGFPTGPFPPLFPPRYDSTRLPAAADGSSWVQGDTFYVSCIFQFEDGSYSLPFVPRPISATLTSGLGLVTVGSISATPTLKYPYIVYQNVPIGPEGTVARILLRTPKQNRTASTDTITVSPLDLRVIGVLRNNTQTLYYDYGGDDDSLVEDENVVRFDLVCPRRARYIGTGDQRVAIGYTLPNTAAIMLSLINVSGGGANNYDQNVRDTETAGTTPYNSRAALVRITSSQLELHYNAAAPTAPDFTATTGNAKAFTFASYATLEAMVDAINATGTGSECEQWGAQLAPGVDGTMPSSSLTLTTFDVANCTTVFTPTPSTTLTTSASFASVGVGMRISGTGISAGTYVVSKASNTSLTMSSAATADGTVTLTFYQETGDNAIVSGGTAGYLRAWGPTVPLLLHLKPSAFPNYDKPDKQGIYYTMASPGAVQTGSSLAPNSFLSGNKLVGHSSPRQEMARTVMGIVDVEGAAVVAYSDGISLLKNVRGGNTGEDFDCRLFTINDGRGCISHLSLVSGNGWAAYATTEGLVATDKSGKEVVISGDVFNASELTGDLAYEISKSAAAAASDADSQTFSCGVIGSKLYVGVMQSGLSPRLLTYDFSKGVEANGLEELLDPERRTTYIWSPPHILNGTNLSNYSIGPIFCLRNASGRLDYICYNEGNAGSTGDGRLERINITSGTGLFQDNGDNVLAYATVAPVVASEFMALQPNRMEATHKTITTGAAIYLANNQTPTFQTASGYSRNLQEDTARTRYNKQVIPIVQAQRGKTDMMWIQWRSSETITGNNKLWRIVLEYDELDNDNAMQALQP